MRSIKLRPAFTLIEALAVIAIIGTLATLTVYVFGGAAARSRDARRKSDLTAISLGFQARYDSRICSNPADLNYYPGRTFFSSINKWKSVSDGGLINLANDCGAFTEYLATIPAEPKNPTVFPYLFDLSLFDPVNSTPISLIGKHYRLMAHLEAPTLQQKNDFSKMIQVWVDTYGGAGLPPAPSGGNGQNYNYIVGK